MTSAVATLLASMAEKLQRSDLAICQTLSNALDAGGRNNLHIPPLSPQHAKKALITLRGLAQIAAVAISL